MHDGVRRLVRDLNALYRDEPGLHQRDCAPEGFGWIEGGDTENNVFSFVRHGEDGHDARRRHLNMAPVVREGYRIGVPQARRLARTAEYRCRGLRRTGRRQRRHGDRQRRGDARPARLAVADAAAAGHDLPRSGVAIHRRRVRYHVPSGDFRIEPAIGREPGRVGARSVRPRAAPRPLFRGRIRRSIAARAGFVHPPKAIGYRGDRERAPRDRPDRVDRGRGGSDAAARMPRAALRPSSGARSPSGRVHPASRR